MTTYIYAINDGDCNRIKTVSAQSRKAAEDKIIEHIRDEYEIDKEFDNYHKFCEYMIDYYDVVLSEIIDIETL